MAASNTAKRLADLNRSESLVSAALGFLLASPAAGHALLASLAERLRWSMVGVAVPHAVEAFRLGGGDLDATALFHIHRDLEHDRATRPGPHEEGDAGALLDREVDVVALAPRSVVVGIEVKVLSSRSRLATQVREQLVALRTLAREHGCPHTAQVVLATGHLPGLPDGVNRATFAEFGEAMDGLDAACRSESDIFAIARAEMRRAEEFTRRFAPGWDYFILQGLLDLASDPAASGYYVGASEVAASGRIEDLSTGTRRLWKVRTQNPRSPKWRPLPEVAAEIRRRFPSATF